MTNEMLRANDTNTSTTLTPRVRVAIEISLKNWRLVMSPEGGTWNRFLEARPSWPPFQRVRAPRSRESERLLMIYGLWLVPKLLLGRFSGSWSFNTPFPSRRAWDRGNKGLPGFF